MDSSGIRAVVGIDPLNTITKLSLRGSNNTV